MSGAGGHYAVVPQEVLETYVNELAVLVANLGHPAHASLRLRQCDRLFSRIDHHMRLGGPLPFRWEAGHRTGAVEPEVEAMDAVYDVLSEALRERGGVVADYATLHLARTQWERLDELLQNGSSFPSPWQPRQR